MKRVLTVILIFLLYCHQAFATEFQDYTNNPSPANDDLLLGLDVSDTSSELISGPNGTTKNYTLGDLKTFYNTGQCTLSGSPVQYDWAEFVNATTIQPVTMTPSQAVCTDANGSPDNCRTTLTTNDVVVFNCTPPLSQATINTLLNGRFPEEFFDTSCCKDGGGDWSDDQLLCNVPDVTTTSTTSTTTTTSSTTSTSTSSTTTTSTSSTTTTSTSSTTTTSTSSTTTTTLAALANWSDFGWVNAWAADETGATDCGGGTCDDAEAVTTWSDVAGSDNLTTANSPTFDANGCGTSPDKASVVFATNQNAVNANVDCADVNSRCVVVIIGKWTESPPSSNDTIIDSATSTRAFIYTNGSSWRYYAGTAITVQAGFPAIDTNINAIMWDIDGTTGGSTPFNVNGTEDDQDGGTNVLNNGVTIASSYLSTGYANFDYCAIGLYEGDITADGQWTALQNYVYDTWGLGLGCIYGTDCPRDL